MNMPKESDEPGGVASPVQREFSPNGYPYFITGLYSEQVVKEFNNFSDYLAFCTTLTLGLNKYFKFHPNPFNK